MKKLSSLLLIFLLLLIAYSFGQTPGTLDTDFGDSGVVFVDFDGFANTANKILVIEEGKILTLGYSGTGNWDKIVNLSRHFSDGFIDNSFGSGGKVSFSMGGPDSQAFDMIRDAEGHIYITGYCSDGPTQDLVICRLNSVGFIDDTFGEDGFVKTDLGHDETGTSIIFQEDGKILVLGHVMYNNGQSDLILCRYHANGTPDYSFSSTGRIVKDLNASSIDLPRGLALHQGKILIASYAYNSNPDDYDALVLAQFNLDGSSDLNFGVSGYSIHGGFSLNGSIMYPATDMVIDPNDHIIVAGPGYGLDGYVHIVFKFLPDGIPDNSFYDNGTHLTQMIGESAPNSICLQPDDKILVGGYHQNLTDDDFCLSRYFENGEYDPVFGQYYGVSWLDVSSGGEMDDRILSLAMQEDGKIMTAGFAYNGNNRDFAIARYISGINVSTHEIQNLQSTLEVYPNPVTAKFIHCNFQLQKKEKVEISLYHIDGRKLGLMFSEELPASNHQIKIQLPKSIQSGYYLLHFSSSEKSEYVKISVLN